MTSYLSCRVSEFVVCWISCGGVCTGWVGGLVGCTSGVMGSGWVLCGYDCGCIAYDG